jgi:hypothetical protein
VPWQREIWTAIRRNSCGPAALGRLPDHQPLQTKLPSGRLAEYAYPRWFFSNRSEDIRGLFCEYCERLGIRWTQSNPRNISVSHRRSVALLDAFVPAKS